MDHKHTPGPWYERDGDIYHDIKDRAYGLANVYQFDDGGESAANARLIAAAPELLRACQECLKVFEEVGIGADFLTNAIKKATS